MKESGRVSLAFLFVLQLKPVVFHLNPKPHVSPPSCIEMQLEEGRSRCMDSHGGSLESILYLELCADS